MTVVVQWIHLIAAATAVGGMAFMLFILMPSLRVLNDEQRAQLVKAVSGRFRWVSWGAMILLIASGTFSIRVRAWEAPWGTYWSVLTFKICLALAVFIISLLLTLPIPQFEPFRARRQRWLTISLSIALVVILLSAYLRGS